VKNAVYEAKGKADYVTKVIIEMIDIFLRRTPIKDILKFSHEN